MVQIYTCTFVKNWKIGVLTIYWKYYTLDEHIYWKYYTLDTLFMGFPTILSALQPFQIYIFNRKYRKLTFSNGPQLMGKRFMANLHASLDSTCKSRISKISTRCRILGGSNFTTFDPDPKNTLKKFSYLGGGPFHNF